MDLVKTVSVIVPNYNNERYLEECIDSILRQRYPVFEVIVVDDHSVDSSLRVLDKIKETAGGKLRVIPLDQNFGVSHARNVGLAMARGEYISTLDADDCWANEFKLGNEMDQILKYEQKGRSVAAYSRVVYMDEQGKQIKSKKIRKYFTGNMYLKLLNTADTKIIPRDYCVKTQLARELGGWREDMSLYEDYEFTLRLSRATEFADTYEDGIFYRIKKNGLSDQSWKVSNKVFWQIFKNNVKALPLHIKIACYLVKVLALISQRLKTKVYDLVTGWR